MCGRTCCSLDPDTLCCACEYKDINGKQCKPTWAKTDNEVNYTPSYNMGPRDVLPCVVSGSHFQEEEERVLCPMMWGIIPPWHKGDYKKNKLSTHNGRLESIETSKLYSSSLQKRQRCIVVCEGFYEWKAGANNKSPKQPYYIYAAQDKGVKADDPTTWINEFSKADGWKGFRVLKLAGIFETFKTEEGTLIYSCTIITRESNKILSWLHHRMPVCFSNEEECQMWLNTDLPTEEVIYRLNNMILQEETLSWHPVSTIVNNVFHKTADCRKEIKPKEEKKNSQIAFMASWLQKGSAPSNKRKSTDNDTDVNNEKDEKISKILKTN
ncbi:abasic site processing protein HMCES [Linepithema humile]|uniref:abasic site processing protein HMCES n=1 Tax=Linepithema humile TaxID=83485 RepID=UPI00351F5E02